MTNFLTTLVFFGVVGGLAYVGWGLEPHWTSKDGTKFMCRMQKHPENVDDRSRWWDVKVGIDGNDVLVFARSRRSGTLRGVWRVVGAANDDDKKRRLYELRSTNDEGATLRVPQSSRCVAVLDRLVP